MCNVIGGLVELGAAVLTPADHLPRVDTSVYCQVAFLCVRLPAEVTPVWPGTAVCPAAVCHQITSHKKSLATVGTREWPLTCVCSLMTRQTKLNICGVVAPVTLVFAFPADVAVTQLHVLVQKILSQTCVIAVGAVEHAFTWEAQRYAMGRDFRGGHASQFH